MQYRITVCYKMEDLLYIYAYTDIQLRIDCCLKKEIWIWHKRNMAQLSASCAIFLCLTKK